MEVPAMAAGIGWELMQSLRRLLRLPETFAVRTLRMRNKYPPLFIVGAPRSGTTVVTQHIINSLRFGYFPNISKAHPLACVSHGIMGKARYRYQPSYESHYGIIDGPMSPSDGWEIFHRWFPRYGSPEPLPGARLHELQTIVRMFEMIFRAPFANKNNANSVRIAYLDQVFNDALYIHVTRNLTDTVPSILASRKKHGVQPNEWWGVAPPQFLDRVFVSDLERTTYQVWGIMRWASEALSKISADRQLSIPYESFCMNPSDVICWLENQYRQRGITLERTSGNPPTSFSQSRRDFDGRHEQEREIERIVAEIEAAHGSQ